MAIRREAERRTEGTILADSRSARKRFGFGGAPQSAIESAPKQADQWFIEFTNTTGTVNDISAQALSVSPITIQTTTQPIDRYGKREYIPTRVDFPEVTVTFYDTVNGKTMIFAKDIYSKFFKNAGLSAENMQSTIEDINSGRKFQSGGTTTSHKNFDKVTIYHFFGSFDNGDGFIQRIVLINPVVTSITFSESDYSQSSLRTISLTLQPENIIFGTPVNNPAIPQWMQEGLEFILEDFDVTNQSEIEQRIMSFVAEKLPGADFDPLIRTEANKTQQKQALSDLNKFYYEMKAIENNPLSTDADKLVAVQNFQNVRNGMPVISVNPSTKQNIEKAMLNPIASKPVDLKSQQNRANELRTKLSSSNPKPEISNNNEFNGLVETLGADIPSSSKISEAVRNAVVESVMLGKEIDISSIADSIAQVDNSQNIMNEMVGGVDPNKGVSGLFGDATKDALLRNTTSSDPAINKQQPINITAPVSEREFKQGKISALKKAREDDNVK